ncbi:MAG: hypothetical protein PHC43_00375 [Candidatus Marinimicrobia bacterium]|jgi:hypothetical protein|nr:hypothetical protein [Candidatus Neomarinimicrobiota bacterium]
MEDAVKVMEKPETPNFGMEIITDNGSLKLFSPKTFDQWFKKLSWPQRRPLWSESKRTNAYYKYLRRFYRKQGSIIKAFMKARKKNERSMVHL